MGGKKTTNLGTLFGVTEFTSNRKLALKFFRNRMRAKGIRISNVQIVLIERGKGITKIFFIKKRRKR